MNSNSISAGVVTPVKNSKLIRSQSNGHSRNSENLNPNMKSPGLKSSNSTSPLIKSATKLLKSEKKKCSPSSSTPSKPLSPKLLIKERKPRKFLIAKKNLKNSNLVSSKSVVCNCDSKINGIPFKCRCVAYESLRASQEEFFKNSTNLSNGIEKELKKSEDYQNLDSEIRSPDEKLGLSETRRESLGVVTGSGKVMQLIKAFENKLTLPKSKDSEENDDDDVERKDVKRKGENWDFTEIRSSLNLDTTQVSSLSSSFCPSELVLTSESLGLSCSLDRSRGSISSRSSSGERRSRRKSAESSGRFSGRNRRQLKATSQKPFKLRTEQRGRCKQEELVKKVHHMLEEEEKQRIPIAQGLPWTTDEPECLVKPPVKESTRPMDVVLHSDIRAEERAEFDHEVAEKMTLIEQYKMERERQQKLAEEEEIKRLRKELVPKAQPMPYFDRPLIPRRSEKNPTIPKEPKFHLPPHKKNKCSMSWSESSYAESCNE